MCHMDEVKQAIDKMVDRMEETAVRNQRETREHLNKLFIYIARLEVSVGKLNVQIEMEREQKDEIKKDVAGIKDRLRNVEVIFLPVTLSVGAVAAYVLKKFGF